MKAFIANSEHDAELRRIYASVPIGGAVTVAYEREPDFFHGLNVMGDDNVAIALESHGSIVGVGCRSVADYWINGSLRRFGYLSGMRSTRNIAATAILRGFECLRDLDEHAPIDAYFSTIIESNHRAMKVLASGSRHPALPRYVDFGTYHTHAIMLNRFRRAAPPKGLSIATGDAFTLDELMAFVEGEAPRRQFRPHWRPSDLGSDRLRGLTQRDFLVATRNGSIVGLVAVWDQRGYKQHRVLAYAPGLGLVRSGLDLATKTLGFAGLPKPGECLSTLHLAMITVANDDVAVLRALISAACKKAAQQRVHFLCAGFHADDPLIASVKGRRSIRYDSRLFVVDWDDEAVVRTRIDGRIPYLEVACL